MKRFYFIVIVLFAAISLISAQSSTGIIEMLESKSAIGGTVRIIQSDNIKTLLYLHLQTQKRIVKNNGWRICVFADSGQEANRKAESVRSVFISRFNEVRPYKIFNSPFYRVYVGDFRTKSEAMKFLKVLEKEFPNAYIVPDVISQSGLN